jgi:WD40 repeat protein
LDAKGHAVGVCLAVLRQSQNVNFAVKAWYATQLRPNAPSVSRVLESGLSESSSAPRRIAATSVLSGHQKAVSAASWSPDGSAVLTASEDETARIWNVKSKREEARLSGHTDYLTAASFRPVAAQHLQPLPRSTREIERLGLSLYPGTRLSEGQGAIASRDSSNGRVLTVKMYAPADYNLVSTHYSSRVYGATTRGSGDVQRITGRTCTLSDVEIMISPAANRAESLVMMWITIPPPLPLATQSYIVTASGDWTARLWNLKTRVQIATLRGHSKSITAAGFSSDGRRIVTSSQDGTSRIWDAATGDQLAKLDSQGYPLLSAMFAPDGIRIVTASMDKTARVYDAAACNEVTRLVGHRLAVAHAIFSPDGSRIATASWDKSARIWDAGSGRELVRFDGHSLPVSSVAFSPDGTRIATASWDKTARVWDARRGRELARLEGHDNLVLSVAFSPDGRRVLTASSDKTARILDISVLD